MDVKQALENQLKNIQTRTGKTLDEFFAHIREAGHEKHGEIRDFLKREFSMGHGDANTLTHHFLGSREAAPPSNDVLGDIYSGAKASLRPIHDKIMLEIKKFGDFEVSPKKGYVALRRKKQFAMLGPKSAERAELGLNLKDAIASNRIVAQAPGGMCQYIVALRGAEDVDAEVIAALQRAFTAAG